MKSYTVRFAHLEELPIAMEGNVIFEGDKVGKMGSSGQSKFNHLHIDVIEGLLNKIVRLNEIGYEPEKTYKPNIKQLNYFIDDELFGVKPVITTPFYDPEYKVKYKKDHPAYDLVPEDRHEKNRYSDLKKEHFTIYWNRSKKGTILKKGFDDGGYGFYILIGFEV